MTLAALLIASACNCSGTAQSNKSKGPADLAPEPEPATQLVAVIDVDLGTLPSFVEERDEVATAVGAFLAGALGPGHEVVPQAEVVQLRSEGRTNAKTGAACKATPALFDQVTERWPDAWLAEVDLSCSVEPCTLAVTIKAEKDGLWKFKQRWTAPLDGAASVSAVTQAAGRLAPPVGPEPTPPMEVPTREERHPIHIANLQASGTWSEPPTTALLAALQGQLDACHQPNIMGGGRDKVSLGLDAEGKVARCETALSSKRPAAIRDSCLCTALGAASFGPGSEDRRVQVDLINATQPAHPVEGGTISAMMGTVKTDGLMSPQVGLDLLRHPVAGCFAANPPPRGSKVKVTMDIGPDGSVTAAEVPQGLDEATRTCVSQALMAGAFTCPEDSETATVTAEVHLRSPRKLTGKK